MQHFHISGVANLILGYPINQETEKGILKSLNKESNIKVFWNYSDGDFRRAIVGILIKRDFEYGNLTPIDLEELKRITRELTPVLKRFCRHSGIKIEQAEPQLYLWANTVD